MAVVQAPYGGVDVNFDVSNNKIYYVDNGGPPASGVSYNVGDMAIVVPVNAGVAPTTVSPWGYRCTTGGTSATWVPLGAAASSAGTTAVASAATIVPTATVFQVSGTAAIVNITATNFQDGASIYVIPTGVFTWTAAGNIGLLGTAVVSKTIIFTLSGGVWYPSVVA